MELPYHLKTLEPLAGALAILRYLGEIDEPEADVDEICSALDLSERRFNKAIRRLVTKGYVQMTGDLVYRLTEQGIESSRILAEYNVGSSPDADSDQGGDEILRRVVLAMPEKLVANQPNTIVFGVDGGSDQALEVPADMIVRFSVLNGDPFTPEDEIFELANRPVQHQFTVTPEAYTQCRVKLQIYQLGPNPDDISVSGGLYVDADVIGAPSTSNITVAYGADISVQVFD